MDPLRDGGRACQMITDPLKAKKLNIAPYLKDLLYELDKPPYTVSSSNYVKKEAVIGHGV